MSAIFKLKTINEHLENNSNIDVPFKRKRFQIHGITVEGVFPAFEGIEIKLDSYYMSDQFWEDNNNNDQKCYREQMRAASRALSEMLKKKPSLRSSFTEPQLECIEKGSDYIPDYTWHHKEDWLVMQLVKTTDHKAYKHTGGSYTWNIKHFK